YLHSTDIKINSLLKEKFHLPSLYPFQELVITRILEQEGLYGKERVQRGTTSQLIILPTGSGKSVCFTLPAMLITSITLIVYPLLSLLSDQKRRMEELGESPIIIKGGQSKEERERIFSLIISNQGKIILTTAEALEQPSIQNMLALRPIGLLVIDEAHVIAQWGLTFRPSYLTLTDSILFLKPHQILAFTATADTHIIEVINKVLSPSKRMHEIKGNIDRENIFYKVIPTLSKIVTLNLLASNTSLRPMIIFFSNRDKCEQVAIELTKRLKEPICRYYHAKLDKKERSLTEKWFFESNDGILCATSAYGMGVDKKNIRTVIHYTLSNDVASFLQESGRGGRDGLPTLSITLLSVGESLKSEPLFASIFLTATTCRRKRMAELIQSPIDYCSGCDVCDNSFIPIPLGEKEILKAIKMAPLRFKETSLAHHLVATSYKPIYPFAPYYGVLKGWRIEDVKIAIKLLINIKKIKIGINKRLYIPICLALKLEVRESRFLKKIKQNIF
ncbi:MAG: ATP-dependent DNA helicase RecQ, partial [Spirochaetia bacterium]|nr:ATP-dependent DNA helicase RecQ [Spirochaetia bacterium]